MSEPSTDRLRFRYQLNRGLTSIADLNGLVKFATQRARELFEAEGASLIMLDRDSQELYFPVVSDVDRWAQLRVGRMRFPANEGVAGWVLQHDQATIVSDTQNDPRFYSGIDRKSKMTTQSMLCAPLRSANGNIGVIQIINPAPHFLTVQDLEFLDQIADDVALACERASQVDTLRSDLEQARQRLRTLRVTAIAFAAILAAAIVVAIGVALR